MAGWLQAMDCVSNSHRAAELLYVSIYSLVGHDLSQAPALGAGWVLEVVGWLRTTDCVFSSHRLL